MGQSGRMRGISFPPGLDPQNVQLVASRGSGTVSSAFSDRCFDRLSTPVLVCLCSPNTRKSEKLPHEHGAQAVGDTISVERSTKILEKKRFFSFSAPWCYLLYISSFPLTYHSNLYVFTIHATGYTSRYECFTANNVFKRKCINPNSFAISSDQNTNSFLSFKMQILVTNLYESLSRHLYSEPCVSHVSFATQLDRF